MSQPYQRVYFNGATGCRLSALDYGSAAGSRSPPDHDRQDMVILHGMRDSAVSMGSIAEQFSEDFRVVVADLRGHGDSDKPGSYTMVQFVADLRALVTHLSLTRLVLVGHSLGGHIVMKYAATYPNDVEKLALVDGMGPPRAPDEATFSVMRERFRSEIENALGLSHERRQMADVDEAIGRLRRNNPRLAEATARLIAESGVEPHPDGGVRWKWDPAVGMVFSTFDHRESELQWGMVECPVLIVTGEHSMDYWSSRGLANARQMHARETERRRQQFKDAIHVEISAAGHMIHYDEPEALNRCLRDFLSN